MSKEAIAIKNWPKDDRPREKLFKSGEHTLSNTELIAILLRNGTRGQSAIDLARSVISEFKTLRNMSHTSPSQWKPIKGLGPAKIAQIRTRFENEVSIEYIAEIFIEVLKHATPTFRKEDIELIVKRLYELGKKKPEVKRAADDICNTYGRRGIHFLKDIWAKHNWQIGG